MPVADVRIWVDVHGIVGEGQATVGGDPHVDAVIVAGAGGDAELGRAGSLGGGGNRGIGLVDDVGGWVDRQVSDLVLGDLEGMVGVERAGELGESHTGVGAAADGDALRCVVVADADLVVGVGGDPLAVIDGLRCRHRVQRPGRAPVG